mmetsp:Transcript_104634/g.165154  ORF Transcript_104634/g.165154 Transcript_104634/m.165154 type:complete len:224 (+) Transcript_104634:1528-2199(+)
MSSSSQFTTRKRAITNPTPPNNMQEFWTSAPVTSSSPSSSSPSPSPSASRSPSPSASPSPSPSSSPSPSFPFASPSTFPSASPSTSPSKPSAAPSSSLVASFFFSSAISSDSTSSSDTGRGEAFFNFAFLCTHLPFGQCFLATLTDDFAPASPLKAVPSTINSARQNSGNKRPILLECFLSRTITSKSSSSSSSSTKSMAPPLSQPASANPSVHSEAVNINGA